MRNGIDTEYYAQHIQCTRDAKSECLYTVQQLLELCFAAREHGMLKMDELINDRVRYPDAFLRKAVALVIEVSNPDNIRDVLHNYIFTSSNVGNQKFLNCMMITNNLSKICGHVEHSESPFYKKIAVAALFEHSNGNIILGFVL